MPPTGMTLNVTIGLVMLVLGFYYWFFRLWEEQLVDVIIAIFIFSLGVAIVYSNVDQPSGKLDLEVKEVSMGK